MATPMDTSQLSSDQKLDFIIEQLTLINNSITKQGEDILAIQIRQSEDRHVIQSLMNRIDKLELDKTKDNIIIQGIPYNQSETPDQLRQAVTSLISKELQVTTTNIIKETYRIGKPTDQNRRVVVKLNDYKLKYRLFTTYNSLQNPKFIIMNDVPYDMRKKKKILLKARYDARKEGKNANFVKGDLFINNVKQVIVSGKVVDAGSQNGQI
jgi:hypothetical protein